MLNFIEEKSCQMVFLSIWTHFHTPSIVYEFQFFHILVSTWYCWGIVDLAMVEVSLCILFASTWWLIMVNILFKCLYFYLYHFFSEVPFQTFCLLIFIFFLLFLILPRFESLRRYVWCEFLTLVCGLKFHFLKCLSKSGSFKFWWSQTS